jgi:glycosyltransferase involved in cell wall biosynthesis
MIKIALITDTNQSAIWRLAAALKYDGLTYRPTAFHPKKPSSDQIKNVQELFAWADLVHIQYWKSGAKIREMFPSVWPTKRKILTHYNPYNLHEENWQDYIKVVVVNKTQQKELPDAKLIPLCTDAEFFKFNPNYTKDTVVNMTVNRIEGKKGVKEVAEACHELGYKFLLVGRPSDPKYVDSVKQLKNVEYRQGISEEELRNCYYKSAIHVCNSIPNYESGTLPVLESMACGVPVISRKVGHAEDLYNGNNLVLLEKPGLKDGLKEAIKQTMENLELRLKLRENGRKTAESRGYHIWRKMHGDLYKGVI